MSLRPRTTKRTERGPAPGVRYLLLVVGFAFVYFAAAEGGLALAYGNRNVTAVWPPTGIAVAVLILGGRRLAPGIFLGAVVANVVNGLPFHLSTGIAVGNTLAPLVAATLLRRTGFRHALDRLRDVFFLIGAAMAAMSISATGGTIALAAGGALGPEGPLPVFSTWWVGDVMGVVLITPFLLTTFANRHRSPMFERPFEAVAAFAVLAGATSLLWTGDLPIRYLVIPLAGLVALRFGPHGAATATLLAAAIGVLHVVHSGAVTRQTVETTLILLQSINATVALTSMSLAALMAERARANKELHRLAGELEQRVDARTAALASATEQLVASESLLEEAQRLAHIGSFQWDAKTDANTWSDELFRIYGLPVGEQGPSMDTYLSFVDPDALDGVTELVLEVMRSGNPANHQYPVLLRDGTRKWVHAYIEVTWAHDGTPTGLHGSCQDITHYKLAEEAWKHSEERFRALLASAPDAMVVVDAGGRIVLTNDEATHLLGYAADELQGLHVATLVTDGLVGEQGVSARHKDGTLVPVDVSTSQVTTDEDSFVFAALRDASARLQTEDALRAALGHEREATDRLRALDETKNAILSAVSHELRTPLTAILGFSDLLRDPSMRSDEEHVLSLVDRIHHNAQRLESLLLELLDLGRLQRGIIQPHRRTIVLRDLIDGALRDMHVRGHRLTVDIGDGTVCVDPGQVERIVENLVDNAVKYTPPDTQIWLHAQPDADGGIEVVVEDDGPGVPCDLHDSIFEPFVRSESDLYAQGTGVGLSIVDRFAKLHGGRAWVEDRDGGGASFHVHLPGPGGPTDHRSVTAAA